MASLCADRRAPAAQEPLLAGQGAAEAPSSHQGCARAWRVARLGAALSAASVSLGVFLAVVCLVGLPGGPRRASRPQDPADQAHRWREGSPAISRPAALAGASPEGRWFLLPSPPRRLASGSRCLSVGSAATWPQPETEPSSAGPLGLLGVAERYPELATPVATWFASLEEGVLSMARYVEDPDVAVFTPEMRAFWRGLVRKDAVRHIFGPGNEVMHRVRRTDLDIVATVETLNLVALYGTPIPSWGAGSLLEAPGGGAAAPAEARAAAVVDVWGRGMILAVQTEKGALADVRGLGSDFEYRGVHISEVVVFRQAFKQYMPQLDILTYTLVASWGQIPGNVSS